MKTATIPATLAQYAYNNGCWIQELTFSTQGIRLRRKGYAMKNGPVEILTFEPKDYSNGDKWMVTGSRLDGVMYAKSLPDAIKKLINY